MQTKSNKVRHIITLTTGQYDHLYNIMCRQEEILDYLNESDDFDPQTFDIYLILFLPLRRLICHEKQLH